MKVRRAFQAGQRNKQTSEDMKSRLYSGNWERRARWPNLQYLKQVRGINQVLIISGCFI